MKPYKTINVIKNMNYIHLTNSLIFLLLTNLVFANNNTNAINIEYEIYDNVVIWGCDYFNGEKGMKINILSVTGGSGNYNITVSGNSKASTNNLKTGEGFVYFFTESDVTYGTIGFAITDTQGNLTTMKPDFIASLVSLFQFALLTCNAPNKCTQNTITHTQANSIAVTSDVYQTSNRIVSSADMPNGNVSYLANKEISLGVGFHVKIVSNFTADIVNPCSITIE